MREDTGNFSPGLVGRGGPSDDLTAGVGVSYEPLTLDTMVKYRQSK